MRKGCGGVRVTDRFWRPVACKLVRCRPAFNHRDVNASLVGQAAGNPGR